MTAAVVVQVHGPRCECDGHEADVTVGPAVPPISRSSSMSPLLQAREVQLQAREVVLVDDRTMFVNSVVRFWSKWGLWISVLSSLVAYAVLSLLSGIRRRSASGWRSILQWAMLLVIWLAYQAAEIAATGALGSLSLSGSDASADEQQLTAFWAPFLLRHLGGPDNMTAYTLEDNMLSLRKGLEMILQIVGVMYAIWNYIYPSPNWDLLAASVIMLVAGGARYLERAWALWRANLDNMQDSSKKTEPADSGTSRSSSTSTEVAVESKISRSLGRELGNDEALLLAQDLFPIWRRALVDSSVEPGSSNQRTSEKIFLLGWRSMCKVVEMELSLMYEFLYTKATMAHTSWTGTGYLIIRFMSPPASAATVWLFWLYRNKEERQLRGSFVIITYLLLGAAVAMDVVWLLRALGSTWMYYFLKTKVMRWWPWAAWLHHQLLCAGRWHRIHRAVLYLDPLWLVFGIDPVRYRRWSSTIGRYNLLRECTIHRHPWCRWLVTKAGLEDLRYLSELPEDTKELLFKRVKLILPTDDHDRAPDAAYTMTAITTCWGEEALRRGKNIFRGNELPIFGREFEQDVLAWHIATCIFLVRPIVRKVKLPRSSSSGHVAAIEAMSEYLMFLVAERRQMLPGLVLHSLLEETRRALEEIWGEQGTTRSRHTSSAVAEGNKDKLAILVRRKRNYDRDWALHHDGRRLVLDAAEIAGSLTNSSRNGQQVAQMLELIFNVWVDKLLYAGVRCSRESHAKQLSAGGELTTVLWMVIQHAGPFRIGQTRPGYKKPDKEKKPEEKKPTEEKKKPEEKKPAEEKKPEEKKAGPKRPMYPYPYPYPYGPYGMPKPEYVGMPMPSPEEYKPEKYEPPPKKDEPKPPPPKEEEPEMPIPEDEVDPDDAKDYKMPIRYVTLY